jgi:Sec7-like guanine-nucleotide exchange factor
MTHIAPLIIDKTTKTPQIILDPDSGTYEVSGRSLPENVVKTYEPVLQWIDQNLGKIKDPIVFTFKVDYLNSASAKMISLILTKLEEYYKSGSAIEIKWYYNYDDDDIQSEGEIYAKIKKLPIKLIGTHDNDE